MHGIAVNYHWSEDEIFSLPFVRLREYQNALLREQGAAVAEDEPDSEELEALQAAMAEIMNRR